MRTRHWDQLRSTVGRKFDPTADTFTLGAITELQLHMYSEFISRLTDEAGKEMKVSHSFYFKIYKNNNKT
jgi:hypothetical protein